MENLTFYKKKKNHQLIYNYDVYFRGTRGTVTCNNHFRSIIGNCLAKNTRTNVDVENYKKKKQIYPKIHITIISIILMKLDL